MQMSQLSHVKDKKHSAQELTAVLYNVNNWIQSMVYILIYLEMYVYNSVKSKY